MPTQKGSRKDRQREKFAEKKSKSATEAPSKTSKGTDSKTDRSTEDGKQIHVETLINNIKSADSRKENEEEKLACFNEDDDLKNFTIFSP